MKRHGKRVAWLTRDRVTVIGAFFLSLAVFTAVLFLPSVLAKLRSAENTADEPAVGTSGFERSAWVVLHDADTLVSLLRVYTDTRTMTVRVVGYPPQTEVIHGTDVTTAKAVYREQGEAVTALIEPDEVLSLSVDAAAALVGEWVGNIPVVLSQPVYSLPSGELTVTPLQTAQLLRYTAWEQGMVEQASIAAQLTAAVLERVLVSKNDLQTVFGAVATVSDTRLHVSQYAAVCEDLQDLAENRTENFCTPSVVAGYTVGTLDQLRYVAEKR